MDILITGSGGFIGKHLIKALFDNDSYNSANLFVTVREKDKISIKPLNSLLFGAKVKNIVYDLVIHLGAFTPKNQEDANNPEENAANISFTNALLTLLLKTPRKIIYISSLDVYEKNKGVIDEYTSVNPSTLYGLSKLFCEKMIGIWADKNGAGFQIIRCGHIYGPGEESYNKLIPSTIKNIFNNTPPVLFNGGRERRSYLHVEDCCRFIINSAGIETNIGPINVVSAVSGTVSEIVNRLILLSGKDLKAIINDSGDESSDYIFDVSKMHKFLGTENKSLDDGLKEEYEYFEKILKHAK